jgi:micrococcal nuclease
MLLAAVLLAASAAQARPYSGLVRRVTSPDTFQLEDGSKVRYLGVLAPSKTSPYYDEATAASRSWIENKEVQLEYGLQERDLDGVWLAYVYADGVFVNGELVKQGVVLVQRLDNDEKYLPELIRDEREAELKKRGQWVDSTIQPYTIRNKSLP